jgi:hypothetical protein
MPLSTSLTITERERIGVIVNNIAFYAAQLMMQASPDLSKRALANLAKSKREHDLLLKRLDEAARAQSDESPLRLIEDLARLPADVAQTLTLVRRCLLASAFLGHCIAQPMHEAHRPVTAEALDPEKQLH